MQHHDTGGVPWERAELHVMGSIEDHEKRLRQGEKERSEIAHSIKLLAFRISLLGGGIAGGVAWGPKLVKMIAGVE